MTKQADEKTKKTFKDYFKSAADTWEALKRMTAYVFNKSPWLAAGTITTTVLLALTPFINAWITSKIIDNLISTVTTSTGLTSEIIILMGYYLIVLLISQLLSDLSMYFDMNIWLTIGRELGFEITEKLSKLELAYYEDPETNTLIIKVKESYSHRPQNFISAALRLLGSTVRIVSGVSILILFSPLLVLVTFVTAIPVLISNIVFGERRYGIWGIKGDVKRDYWSTKHKLENEASLKEVRVFGSVNYLLNRVKALFTEFQDEERKTENKRMLANTILGLLRIGGLGFTVVVIVLAVIAQRITIGQFSFYFSTARELQGSFVGLLRTISRIYNNSLYVTDIFKILDLPLQLVPGTKKLPQNNKPPKIEIKNVSFKYPNSEPWVIQNLNLTIKSGENIAIVGENGAGKTTLINLLMRFYDVTEGQILVDGIDLRELNTKDWYLKVGTLFQQFNTYHFDAKTNISIGNPAELDNIQMAITAAKQSGADDFIKEYDLKYEQILSKRFENGIEPSWGQWQKIALARTFFKNPPIIILDEPTSAIDPKSEYEIFEELFKFAEEKTVIIISHRFSTVRNAQRIIVLDNGKIIEEGSHEKLMEIENGKYKHAFELQKKGYE